MNCNENCFKTIAADCGPKPFITDIDKLTMQNKNYRTALWTGKYLQATMMCIPSGGEIGLEVHCDTDQFIKIVDGSGSVMMGPKENCLNLRRNACAGFGVFVPAGTWHNIVNNSCRPLKLYTVYAPPHHPHGTVQRTKAEADTEGT